MNTYPRRSLFWPLFLVAIGVVFLLNNISMLPGNFWDMVIRYWPILLIVAGLDSIYRGEGLFGSIFIIAVGTFILIANLGYVTGDIWGLLLRYWPLLIITIGLDVILSRVRRSTWVSIAGLVLAVVVIGVIVWFAGLRTTSYQKLASTNVSQALSGEVKQADLNFIAGIGKLTISPQPDASKLVSGTVHTQTGTAPLESYSQDGMVGNYSLTSQGATFAANYTSSTQDEWNLGITTAIPVQMEIKLGAGECNISLNGIQITSLAVTNAVGKCTVALPQKGNFSAQVTGVIGETLIIVPNSLPVSIHVNPGLSSLQIPAGFTRSGETITSPNYNPQTNHIDLEAQQVIGELVIQSGS
ncbi:MAG: DUF5668 domain-containing protein [Chloroflexi bacterium]|nr:DUF5668 domain-containing protein [Chloroflexota bacterium]